MRCRRSARSVCCEESTFSTASHCRSWPLSRWHLIVDGHALVMRDGTPLGLLGHGESWSEHSLLNDQRSPITVVALSPMRLLSISARQFFDLSETHPVVSR